MRWSGLVLNEVKNEYNGFGQLIREYQAHDGSVNLATTPKVEYAYADGSANTIRPTGLTYPNGQVIFYDYGVAGSTDDATSRPRSIRDGLTPLVNYDYLGVGTPIEADYLEPDLRHTLVGTAGGTDPDTGDIYLKQFQNLLSIKITQASVANPRKRES